MQEDLFYQYLSQTKNIQKSAFENNWPYILQATRNGLHVFEKNDSILYYTKRVKGDDISPNVIVNYLGFHDEELVVSFVESQLQKGVHTIVKNVDVHKLEKWKKLGFTETSNPWSIYSSRDDNSFPQYNVSRKTIESVQFGDDVKSQIQKFSKSRVIHVEAYDSAYDADAKKLLHSFSEYSQIKGNDYAEEVENAHLFFFDENIKHKIRLQHVENGELVGFSFLTPVGNICFYNAVICKKERNLMKYLVYQAMDFVCKKYPKIQIFGMQGSENAGQDYLKKRLRPCEIIKKTHIIK